MAPLFATMLPAIGVVIGLLVICAALLAWWYSTSKSRAVVVLPGYLRIGVVGYSKSKFDQERAWQLLASALEEATAGHDNTKRVAIVSGLTDLGVPALAYRIAVQRGWKTFGIACEKAATVPWFPVDHIVIDGKDWGDESPLFLDNIDVLVKVGGGAQSEAEAAEARRRGMRVLERQLEATKAD